MLYSLMMIEILMIYPGIVTLFRVGMGFVTINLNNISLDDDILMQVILKLLFLLDLLLGVIDLNVH